MRAPLGPRDRSGARDCTPSVMTEVALDPFGSVGSLLGYVIGMLGIAMLVYIVWFGLNFSRHFACRHRGAAAHSHGRLWHCVTSNAGPHGVAQLYER